MQQQRRIGDRIMQGVVLAMVGVTSGVIVADLVSGRTTNVGINSVLVSVNALIWIGIGYLRQVFDHHVESHVALMRKLHTDIEVAQQLRERFAAGAVEVSVDASLASSRVRH